MQWQEFWQTPHSLLVFVPQWPQVSLLDMWTDSLPGWRECVCVCGSTSAVKQIWHSDNQVLNCYSGFQNLKWEMCTVQLAVSVGGTFFFPPFDEECSLSSNMELWRHFQTYTQVFGVSKKGKSLVENLIYIKVRRGKQIWAEVWSIQTKLNKLLAQPLRVSRHGGHSFNLNVFLQRSREKKKCSTGLITQKESAGTFEEVSFNMSFVPTPVCSPLWRWISDTGIMLHHQRFDGGSGVGLRVGYCECMS